MCKIYYRFLFGEMIFMSIGAQVILEVRNTFLLYCPLDNHRRQMPVKRFFDECSKNEKTTKCANKRINKQKVSLLKYNRYRLHESDYALGMRFVLEHP